MRVLLEKDYLEVKTASLLADYDRGLLTNLYQPIIGFTALAVYLNLWSEYENQKITPLSNHGDLFIRMGLSAGKFVDARKHLEATGLLKTYVNKINDVSFYSYFLYAPKHPRKFFDDALLCGMLIKNIGEQATNKLKALYKFEPTISEKHQDISASFVEVFQPNFDHPAFKKALEVSHNILARDNGKINSEFSYELFFSTLKDISQISNEAFTKKDMKEIERLATLYGVDEVKTANFVSEIYDPYVGKGKHVDFEKLTKLLQDETNYRFIVRKHQQSQTLISGESDLAHKINHMETISPKDYLSILQGGTKPATSDLKLINDISKNFQLTNGVINALIDFTLTVNNNVLSRAYVEKISASIAREGITSAHETMNYLKKVNSQKRKRFKYNQGEETSSIIKEEQIETPALEENNGLSWEEMMEKLAEE